MAPDDKPFLSPSLKNTFPEVDILALYLLESGAVTNPGPTTVLVKVL